MGDHWEPKESRGPSDEQSEKRGAGKSRQYASAEGVDANASKAHLRDVANRLDISGRSKMNKDGLVDAIQKANRRETAKARET